MDYFIGGLNTWARFNSDGEDAVGARGSRVQVVLAEGAVQLTLEETIECVFFRITHVLLETFDKDTTTAVISDLEVLLIVHKFFRGFSWRE